MGHIFLLSCTAWQFLLASRHCNIYFCYVWIFIIHKYSWALFWATVKLPGKNLNILSLVFKTCYVGLQQRSFQDQLFPLLRQGSSVHFTQCPANLEVFPAWLVGTDTIPALCDLWALLPRPLLGTFPELRFFSQIESLISSLSNTGEPSAGLPSLVARPEKSTYLILQTLRCFNIRNPQSLSGFPFLYQGLDTLSR